VKACGDMRERLGEWLAGALEGEDATAVERHVGACAGCARELAAMAALEEDLLALKTTCNRQQATANGESVARRRPARWVAMAAVALVAVAVGLVAGVRSGAAGANYVAAVVEAESGARLERLDGRGVRLDRGAAEVHVQPGSGASAGAFRVETPLGRFTVNGTRFRISVEEEVPVTNAGKAATIAVVAVVSGTVGYLSSDGRARGEVGAGERGVAREGSFEVAAAEPPKSVEREEIARLKKEIDAIQAERKTLAAEIEKGRSEKQAIEARLAAVEQARLDKARAAAAPAEPAKRKLSVSFGPHASLPEVTEANWSEMGEAVKNINGLIGDIVEREKTGQEATDLQIAIAKESAKLQKFAFAAIGKLPSHVMGNGEFTHPIALANLLAAHLEAAALPLTERQVSEIAGFGEEYDFEWERLQSTYSADTYKLEQVLDEMEVKHRFTDKVLGILTPEQRAVIAPEGIHDCAHLDVHSPLLMLSSLGVQGYPVATAAEIEAKVLDAVGGQLHLEAEERDLVRPLVARMAAEIVPKLSPVASKNDVPFYPYVDAIAVGRAVLKLRKELPGVLGLDEEGRAKLRNDAGFAVPRLVPRDLK
jgi:hypothetical protein